VRNKRIDRAGFGESFMRRQRPVRINLAPEHPDEWFSHSQDPIRTLHARSFCVAAGMSYSWRARRQLRGCRGRMIELKNRLAGDPNWNGGWYYQRGGIARTLTALRIDTLKRYGYGEWLAAKYADAGARDRALHEWPRAGPSCSTPTACSPCCAPRPTTTPRRISPRSAPSCSRCSPAPTSSSRRRSRPASWRSSNRPGSTPRSSRSRAPMATSRATSSPRNGCRRAAPSWLA
jgi:hypothetical protein